MGHLRKLYPNESVSLDRFAFVRWYVDEEVSLDSVEEANVLVRTFGGLDLQDQPDGYSERNIFEDLCTKEGIGAGKVIFEGGFKFAASEARK